MVYLLAISMFAMFLIGLRFLYVGGIFYYYVGEHHPEVSKDFKSYRPFRTKYPFYKEYDIDDPEFHRLQKRARNTIRWMGFSLLLPVLLMIGFFIKCFFFGP